MPAIDSEVRFCPKCGSCLVEYSALAGGDAACGACSWKGGVADLLVTPFKHDLGSNEEVLRAFSVEFRNTLAKNAGVQLGRLLINWGLLTSSDADVQTKQLSRLLAAMAKGAVQALIEERAALVRENGG